MPTKRTKRNRAPKKQWPSEMRKFLETGERTDASVNVLPFFDSRFHTVTVVEAWEDLKEIIMRDWTDKKNKPWAWGIERLSKAKLLHL